VSPSLPIVSGREVVSALAKVGFSEVSQRGSHLKLRNQAGITVIVPMHRELARGRIGAHHRSGLTPVVTDPGCVMPRRAAWAAPGPHEGGKRYETPRDVERQNPW
jgi:predicted RNA binding protein YcfA (HicA-like mRNA interferase family)